MGVERKRLSNYLFAALFLAGLALFARVIFPVIMPVLLACFLVVLFMPMHALVVRRFRLKPHVSAGISTVVVFLSILVPPAVVGYLVARELLTVLSFAQEAMDQSDLRHGLLLKLPVPLRRYILLVDPSGQQTQQALGSALANGASVLTTLFSATSEFAVDVFLLTVSMYYFFLDGRRLFKEAERTIPIDPRYLRAFAKEFQDVARAMIYGNAMTGLLQGLTGFVGLTLARVPHAHIWALAMIVVAFLPVGGTALVWGPIGVALILGHHLTEGLFVLCWGVVMVGVVDNLARPKLCSSKMALHPLLVFLSMFGGFAVFGMMGILVGPLIASLFMAMVRIYRRDYLGLLPAPEPAVSLPAESPPAPLRVPAGPVPAPAALLNPAAAPVLAAAPKPA